MGRGYLTSRDWPGAPVTSFNANAVALCHCFIPGQLRHHQPAIRRQFLKVTKSEAEASSAAP